MEGIQNEIRTRSERDTNLHHSRPSRDETRQGSMQGCIGIPLLECQVSWNKHLKNEIHARKTRLAWDHAVPVQNTKPFKSRKYTPKYTSEPQIQTKITKKYKSHPILCSFHIFCWCFGFWSVFWGVFSGFEGFCILHGDRVILKIGINSGNKSSPSLTMNDF